MKLVSLSIYPLDHDTPQKTDHNGNHFVQLPNDYFFIDSYHAQRRQRGATSSPRRFSLALGGTLKPGKSALGTRLSVALALKSQDRGRPPQLVAEVVSRCPRFNFSAQLHLYMASWFCLPAKWDSHKVVIVVF